MRHIPSHKLVEVPGTGVTLFVVAPDRWPEPPGYTRSMLIYVVNKDVTRGERCMCDPESLATQAVLCDRLGVEKAAQVLEWMRG